MEIVVVQDARASLAPRQASSCLALLAQLVATTFGDLEGSLLQGERMAPMFSPAGSRFLSSPSLGIASYASFSSLCPPAVCVCVGTRLPNLPKHSGWLWRNAGKRSPGTSEGRQDLES